MKKTLQVNIGGRPFIIDEDAYLTLRQYLDEVGIRLDGSESSEVMEDIETRIADLFQETLSSRIQVVNLDAVRHAIAILGSAKEFGEPIRQPPRTPSGSNNPHPRLSKNGFTAAVTTGCWEAFAEALPLLRPRSIAGPYHHSRPGRFHRSGDPSLYHPVDRRPDGTPANYRRHRFERPIKTRPLWLLM